MGNLYRMFDKKLELNSIYLADNLAILKTLPNDSIDLIYIDPPFNTRSVKKSKTFDDKVQGLEYYDSYGNGIFSYVAFMKDRLEQMYRVLKPTGSLFVHVDYRSVHYLKVELDKIFGRGDPEKGSKLFINEIIWHYRRWTGSSKSLQKMHDTILWYAKSENYIFNPPYIEPTEGQLKKHKKGWDRNSVIIDGKRQPQLIIYDEKKVNKAIKSGKIKLKDFARIVRPKTKKTVGHDVFYIDYLNSQAKERVGYPTQKPLALLEKLIKMASNEKSVVADFFCGCGTALSAAQKLNRYWIGVDASRKAVEVIRKRMFRDHNLNIDISTLKKANLNELFNMKPKDFETTVVQLVGGVPNYIQGGDGGVDGVMPDTGEPIQVKQWIPNRSEFDKFYKHLKKSGQGYYIAYDFTSGIKEEVKRLKIEEGIECRLITIGDILEIPSDEYKNKLTNLRKIKKAG